MGKSSDNVGRKKVKNKKNVQNDQGMQTLKEDQRNEPSQPEGQPSKPPVYALTEEYEISKPRAVDTPVEPSLYVLTEEHKKPFMSPVGLPAHPPLYVLTREYNKPVRHSVVLAKQSPMYVLTEGCQSNSSQPLKLRSPTFDSREDHSKPCHSTLLTNPNQFNSHSKSVESPLNKHFSFTVLDPGHLNGPCTFNKRPTSFEEYIECYQQQTRMLQQYEQLYLKQYQALLAYQNLVQEQSQGNPPFYHLQEPPKEPLPTGIFDNIANIPQITVSALPRPEDTLTIKEPQQRSKPLETFGTSREIDESSLLCYDVHITITPNGQPLCSSSKNSYPKSSYDKSNTNAPSPLPVIITDERNENLSRNLGKVSPHEENNHQDIKTRFCSVTQSQQPSVKVDNEWRSSPLSIAELKRNILRNRRRAHPINDNIDYND